MMAISLNFFSLYLLGHHDMIQIIIRIIKELYSCPCSLDLLSLFLFLSSSHLWPQYPFSLNLLLLYIYRGQKMKKKKDKGIEFLSFFPFPDSFYPFISFLYFIYWYIIAERLARSHSYEWQAWWQGTLTRRLSPWFFYLCSCLCLCFLCPFSCPFLALKFSLSRSDTDT